MAFKIEDWQRPSLRWHWRSLEEFKAASWFTLGNYANIILLVVFLVAGIIQIRLKNKEAKKAGFEKRFLKAPEFPDVEECSDFDWRTTEPLKLRPFKPKYHLTMGDFVPIALENITPSELLLMDKNYHDRVNYRRGIMEKHGEHVVAVHDNYRIRPAVVELYQFLLGTYLPLRFPTMFKLHETAYESGQTFMLENLVTKALYPAQPSANTPTTRLLETLGRTIDEDFLFLLPEDDAKPTDNVDKDSPSDAKYILEAYVCCCPSGFDPLEKLGKRLASIHAPVPGYPAKLENSMDRFFTRLEVGKYVRRTNWSLTTNTDLYAGHQDNHGRKDDVLSELTDAELDVENTVLRCERQTLHRLPKSKAIVFGFKTYQYPISQIKEEGMGEELAEAIDGLGKGSVPEMAHYKRGVVWGPAVQRYLRS